MKNAPEGKMCVRWGGGEGSDEMKEGLVVLERGKNKEVERRSESSRTVN
jgi:hypothetical protein